MSLLPYIKAFANRDVSFKFSGRVYRFFLSHGLFSSADIDSGSRLLLKVLSGEWVNNTARDPPRAILDAGSGVGVLGIIAADMAPDAVVTCQDRDELARIFTEYNARLNNIPGERLLARAEPLLTGPPGASFDLILTNIPAKAGLPVLEDFVRRSVAMLNPGGRVFMVAVNPLADFFRSRVKADAALLAEETGPGHTVFVYGEPCGGYLPSGGSSPHGKVSPHGGHLPRNKAPEHTAKSGALNFDERFPAAYPFYMRKKGRYTMENVSYLLETVYGAPDFDNPGNAVEAAAKLAVKLSLIDKLPVTERTAGGPGILVHDDAGQGHFISWLGSVLARTKAPPARLVLSGRNILSLFAARASLSKAGDSPFTAPHVVPAADLLLDSSRLAEDGPFAFIAYFPEPIAGADRTESAWEALGRLAAPGGIVTAAMTSASAAAFDREKARGFTRLGNLKRGGFRALAYQAAARSAPQ